MTKRNYIKIVYEGNYMAEVDVDLIDTTNNWSPYISWEDTYKLDDVRDALRDIKSAAKIARVYTLTPVAISYLSCSEYS